MKYARCITLVLAALLAAPAHAQQPVVAVQAGAPDRPKREQRVVRMTLQPAAPGRPALRHRLLPPAAERTSGNAAVLYQTAFKLTDPIRKPLDEAYDELADGKPDPARIRSIIGQPDASHFRYAILAARCNRCDFQVPLREEGFSVLLPHLNDMRQLANLVAFQARALVAESNHDEAIRFLQVGFAMANHLDEDPLLVQSLVATAISSLMIQRVEELIDSPGSPNLYWALTELPSRSIGGRRALENERNTMAYTLPQLQQAREGKLTPEQFQGALDSAMANLGHLTAQPRNPLARIAPAMAMVKFYPDAKKYLLAKGLPPQQVEAMPPHQVIAEFLLGTYEEWSDEMNKWALLPYWQAMEGMKRTEEEFRNARADLSAPLASMFLPALWSVNQRIAEADRRIASLRCVEAIRAYAATHAGRLPQSLDQITETPAPIDPMTGKPFAYRLEGATAIIDAPAMPGDSPDRGWRYEITVGN